MLARARRASRRDEKNLPFLLKSQGLGLLPIEEQQITPLRSRLGVAERTPAHAMTLNRACRNAIRDEMKRMPAFPRALRSRASRSTTAADRVVSLKAG